jgi:hypothetical protein
MDKVEKGSNPYLYMTLDTKHGYLSTPSRHVLK